MLRSTYIFDIILVKQRHQAPYFFDRSFRQFTALINRQKAARVVLGSWGICRRPVAMKLNKRFLEKIELKLNISIKTHFPSLMDSHDDQMRLAIKHNKSRSIYSDGG
jgi:hypothetical protein